MKALFLAGGMNTKLKPLTDELPKAMVPMMVKPLLERNMLKLKECGIDEIIVSTCYKSQKIEEYFGDGTKLGFKIHYINEERLLGTGGTIKGAEEFLSDTFIIFNDDILSDININDMIKFHKEKCAAVTIAIVQAKDSSNYSTIGYNENLYAESFNEESNYINAGIYIVEPNVLKEIPDSQTVSLEKETYPLLLKKGYPIAVYKSDAYWTNINTTEKYIQANRDILNGICPFPEIKDENQGIFVGKNTNIPHSTKLIAPVCIGENSRIGAYSTIGPNTIIGNNCKIATNSIITDSIIWDKMSIQNGSTFSNVVLSSNFMLFNSTKNTSENKSSNKNRNF